MREAIHPMMKPASTPSITCEKVNCPGLSFEGGDGGGGAPYSGTARAAGDACASSRCQDIRRVVALQGRRFTVKARGIGAAQTCRGFWYQRPGTLRDHLAKE